MNTNDPEVNRQPTNPDDLNRLLEIELIQKRAEWQRTSSRHKSLRSASFVFLFIIVMAALVGFYFVFLRVSENRQHRPTDSAERTQP